MPRTIWKGSLVFGIVNIPVRLYAATKLKARTTDVKPVEASSPYEVRWVKPELVCEVKFMEVTPDLKLRAPAFRRLRFDKAPEECEIPISETSEVVGQVS